MVEKLQLLEESKKQHNEEKHQVDEIIQKLINEDKKYW